MLLVVRNLGLENIPVHHLAPGISGSKKPNLTGRVELLTAPPEQRHSEKKCKS